MSQLNPFGGSSSSVSIPSGTTNALSQTMNDADIGSQIMGDNTLSGGGSSGNADWLSSIAKALNPSTAASAQQQPQVQADKSQSSPVDSGSGTQSSTSPGQAPPQGGQGGSSGQPAQSQDAQGRAAAVPQLNALLNALTGKPEGPTWILPQVKPGETGPQSPVQGTTPIAQLINQLVGSKAADASLPPDQGGRDVTVQPKAAVPDQFQQAAGLTPATPPAAPPAAPVTPPAPTPPATPLTGAGGAPLPSATQAQPGSPDGQSRLIRDLTGISQGNPMALADLAAAIYGVALPLALMRGGKGGGVPGVKYGSGTGDILYGGALNQPVLPGFDKNGQPAPSGTFNQKGQFVGSVDKTTTSNQIPGVSAKIADDYIRQAAPKFGIDPNVASRFMGAESAYGQNNLGDKDAKGNPTSFGPLQLHLAPNGKAMGDQFLHETGQNPRNFAQNWKQQIDYALKQASKYGWTPGWTTSMNKLGLNQWSGINRNFAARPTSSSPVNIAPAAISTARQ